MNLPFALQHEAAELTDTITKNYELYSNSGLDRDERGKLLDPLAETFEQRFNKALEQYYDLCKSVGKVTISSHQVA